MRRWSVNYIIPLLSVIAGAVPDLYFFFFQLGIRDLDCDLSVGAVAVLVRG